MVQRALGVAVGILAACGLAGAAAMAATGGGAAPLAHRQASTTTTAAPPTIASTLAPATTSTTSTVPTTTTIQPVTTLAPQPVSANLAGCPVPPRPGPTPPPSPPWHPAVLVPDSALPPVEPPAPWHSSLAAIGGKGMWIWLWSQTDSGNAQAVVHQALAAGLHQLWVRVGDSKYGFYGASELAELVPVAHAAGLSVVAWGFPYLYDPAGDANWSAQILSWRDPAGQAVDAYSADIERPTEGVDLTAQRAAVYLQQVRKAAGSTPVVATVYPPLDAYWSGGYPYSTIAGYVDAFAPMVYWECIDPGTAAQSAIQRLSTLRPVHVIGQAFNMADVGGRTVAPSGSEITEFLAQARKDGALGASFWVWQTATAEEWSALSGYQW
ncbi:MAG TPA: hypothetical protein VFV02_09165 [Acidimicrobiales bacterium]|nr:hypothetical protein [Acidimicrobiales bacterium]